MNKIIKDLLRLLFNVFFIFIFYNILFIFMLKDVELSNELKYFESLILFCISMITLFYIDINNKIKQ